MFRAGLQLARPLVNHNNTRGMSMVKDVQAAIASVDKQKLRKTLMVFAKELAPPTPSQAVQGVSMAIKMFKNPNWRNITVREAWLNTLVTTEVICWFFVGECIGKGTLIGYQV